MKFALVSTALVTALAAAGCGAVSDTQSADAASGLSSVGPSYCTIQAYDGHYLTAVGGGNRTTDVIHTDATRVGNWEKFTLIDSLEGDSIVSYGFRTWSGKYLSVQGGGGRITDVIQSNRTSIQAWERIKPISIGGGWYGLQTVNGNYLTAVDSGGRITDTIHSDATQLRNWEKFKLNCRSQPW